MNSLIEHSVRYADISYLFFLSSGNFSRLIGVKFLDVINNEPLLKEMNANFEKVAPIAFGYERETDFSKQVSKAMKTFYFQDKPVDKSQIAALAQVSICTCMY